MTAFYTEDSLQRVLKSGTEACIAKPLDQEKRISTINPDARLSDEEKQ